MPYFRKTSTSGRPESAPLFIDRRARRVRARRRLLREASKFSISSSSSSLEKKTPIVLLPRITRVTCRNVLEGLRWISRMEANRSLIRNGSMLIRCMQVNMYVQIITLYSLFVKVLTDRYLRPQSSNGARKRDALAHMFNAGNPTHHAL